MPQCPASPTLSDGLENLLEMHMQNDLQGLAGTVQCGGGGGGEKPWLLAQREIRV